MASAIQNGFDPFGAKIVCSWCGARFFDLGEPAPRCHECEQCSTGEVGVDLDGHRRWHVRDEAGDGSGEVFDEAVEAEESGPEPIDPTVLREDLVLDEVFGDDHWHR